MVWADWAAFCWLLGFALDLLATFLRLRAPRVQERPGSPYDWLFYVAALLGLCTMGFAARAILSLESRKVAFYGLLMFWFGSSLWHAALAAATREWRERLREYAQARHASPTDDSTEGDGEPTGSEQPGQ